jgi:serine/threonine protein kinase
VTTELAPLEGRLIADRYELRSVIGRGGAGTVWRAEDVLLRRPVAVKEVHLPATLGEDERRNLRERVLREARAAAAVRHPVLVTVFDVVEDGDRPWIVLELIEAGTLAAHVHERTLTPAEAARVGIDLLAALQAVHRAGIQHRDVKPGNVLIEADGRPRLTDFGIASTAGEAGLTSTGVLLGSPSYLPPERARGGAGGPESDLWGLAATLYTAVEGQPPYEGSHPLAVLTAVVEGRRRPMQQAGELEPLLADLLDRDPAHRPAGDEVRKRLVEVAQPGLAPMLLDPARSPGVPAPQTGVATNPAPAVPDAIESGSSGATSSGTSAAGSWPAGRAALGPPTSATDAVPLGTGPHEDLSSTSAFATSTPGTSDDAASGRSSVPARERKRPARKTALLAAAAALVLLLVGAAVVGLGHRGSSSNASTASAPSTGATDGSAPAAALAPAALDATAASAPTPPGWVRYTDASGWSIAHPSDWRQTRLGDRGVDFVQPGTGAYLHVETAQNAPSSVTEDWIAQEKLLAPRVSNYQRVDLRPADGGTGERAADWEFTFGLAGSPLRALDRGLVVDGTGYSLYWQTPASAWTSSLSTVGSLYSSFAAH